MHSNLYPITFYPIYKEYIWGGTNLKKWGKTSDNNIAESFEISAESIISNGIYKNTPLINITNKQILGKYSNRDFPLLIKLIDAKENLSIQVHPDNEYAKNVENAPFGKNEMWYILECEPNSYIYYGLIDNISKNDILQALNNGTIEKYLYKKYIKTGDTIYIPAGTVHAITKGITLLEIQQNCNITYRLYDYNRKDKNGKERELHIDKALDVIDYENTARKFKQEFPIIKLSNNNFKQTLINCEFFSAQYLNISSEEKIINNKNTFSTLTVIDGLGNIKTDNITYPLLKGNSILIPAYLNNYILSGNMHLIKSIPI